LKKITLFALLLGGNMFAQIINTAPYILTVDELKAWTQDGPTASPDLVCDFPVAPRFTNQASQFNPALTNDMQIVYLPDGMNNFGNYFVEQNQFNLYNFTHWSYIDKFVWFGGTSSQSIQLPSEPWTYKAHENGVKMFGNVFFAPTAFGGSTATLQNFLEQDTDGNFVAVAKMIAIMQYYGFDGWFINQETATNATVALLMHDFVRDLTAAAEAVGKEVMWYDAMRLNGAVGWQNRLNLNNSPFVQDDEDADGSFETRVSSSIFINFFWGSSSFPSLSRERAQTIGRSQYEVFTGADIWPGRNQGDFETGGNTFMGNLHENATTPYTSLGLFAPNCVYNNSTYSNFNNDPNDYESFYAAETRMFAGADSNPATVDATGWKGFCNWIPEASNLGSSFFTTFNTGHGKSKFVGGSVSSNQGWHDISKQEPLPTWQWAFSQNGILSAKFDFDTAFAGGSSVKVSGNLPANTPIDLMLFKTKTLVPPLGEATTINLTYKTAVLENHYMKVIVVFTDEPNQRYEFPVPSAPMQAFNGWGHNEVYIGPPYNGREIAMIGLRFYNEAAVTDYAINIGGLFVFDDTLATQEQTKNQEFVIVSYPKNSDILFTVNWPSATKINYSVFDLQGQKVKSDAIELNQTTKYYFEHEGLASGTYIVKFTDQNDKTVTKKIIVR
jgi:endo-beta-N-acetylglucosaminidase D